MAGRIPRVAQATDVLDQIFEAARLREGLKLEKLMQRLGQSTPSADQVQTAMQIVQQEKVPRDLNAELYRMFVANAQGPAGPKDPYGNLGQQIVPYQNVGRQFGLSSKQRNPGYEPFSETDALWKPAGQFSSVGRKSETGWTEGTPSKVKEGMAALYTVPEVMGKNVLKRNPAQLRKGALQLLESGNTYNVVRANVFRDVNKWHENVRKQIELSSGTEVIDAMHGRPNATTRAEAASPRDLYSDNKYLKLQALKKFTSEYVDSYAQVLIRKLKGLPPEENIPDSLGGASNLNFQQYVDQLDAKYPEYFSRVKQMVNRSISKSLAKQYGWHNIDVIDIVSKERSAEADLKDVTERIIMGTQNRLARFGDEEGRMFGPVWKLGLAGLLGAKGLQKGEEKKDVR